MDQKNSRLHKTLFTIIIMSRSFNNTYLILLNLRLCTVTESFIINERDEEYHVKERLSRKSDVKSRRINEKIDSLTFLSSSHQCLSGIISLHHRLRSDSVKYLVRTTVPVDSPFVDRGRNNYPFRGSTEIVPPTEEGLHLKTKIFRTLLSFLEVTLYHPFPCRKPLLDPTSTEMINTGLNPFKNWRNPNIKKWTFGLY